MSNFTKVVVLVGILLLFGIVSATDYCAPTTVNATYTHNGNWFNFTFTNYQCPFCVNTGMEIDCTNNCLSSPTASFVSNVTCGKLPFSVMFNDTSLANGAPITSWFWDFGDGNTSTSQNVSYKYVTVGKFTVKHRATNSYGDGWSNQTDYITTGTNWTFCSKGNAFDPSELVHYNQSYAVADRPVDNTNEVVWILTALLGIGLFLLSTLERRLARPFIDLCSIFGSMFLFLATIWSFSVDTVTSSGAARRMGCHG
jgi:PKD repeat protein